MHVSIKQIPIKFKNMMAPTRSRLFCLVTICKTSSAFLHTLTLYWIVSVCRELILPTVCTVFVQQVV